MDETPTIYDAWIKAQKRILAAARAGRGIRLSREEVASCARDIETWDINLPDQKSEDR